MTLRRARLVVLGWAALFAAAPFAAAPAARADVIYRETFGHNAAADPGPALFDWTVHSGLSGTWRNVGSAVTNQANVNATGGTTFNGVTGANSNPYDLLNVNAGEPTVHQFDTNGDTVPDSNPRGFAYVSGTAWGATSAERRALYWTPEFSFNPANYVAGSIVFSWRQGNANQLDTLSPAVRIGSQWYVATETFTNAPVVITTFASAAELKEFTFTRSASAWNLLDFDGTYDTTTDTGTPSTNGLSVGLPLAAELPAGPVTAFGLFSNDPRPPARATAGSTPSRSTPCRSRDHSLSPGAPL
jgi:hypothetical protein